MAGGWDGDSLWPKARSFISKASAFVIGAVISATNRLLTEAGHPKDWSIDWYQRTLASFGSITHWRIDMDRLSKLQVTVDVYQAAAAGDGAFRLYNISTATAFSPTSVAVPQGTIVSLEDAEFTADAGAAGVDEIRPEPRSGQAGVAITVYGGGLAREVLA